MIIGQDLLEPRRQSLDQTKNGFERKNVEFGYGETVPSRRKSLASAKVLFNEVDLVPKENEVKY